MRQFRLVHVGVAAVLGAATVTAVGLVQSATAAGGGTPSVFVPITPCRLVDTRPGSDNVGTRATPIGSGEAATFAVWNTNGHCTIPNTATGIATNTTAVNPTAGSFLTIYPADASPRPTASNLNFTAGSSPIPNQVTVGLSAAGAIGVFNLSGTVDIIVDIVGYYQPAAAGGGGGGGSKTAVFSGAGFVPESDMYTYFESADGISPGTFGCFNQRLDLPVGATITLLSTIIRDSTATGTAQVFINSITSSATSSVQMASLSTPQAGTPGTVSIGTNAITSPTVTKGVAYSLRFCGSAGGTGLYSVSVDYDVP
ncbi:MAG TPA: hypothetical protein VHN36_15830 [Ilumatobacteraceae bacterium]|nr:hypothetical protein [Ilumatobacteraceae bacterium]